MSESGDFDPGPWSGHDFREAYARYDEHVGRSYEDAVADSKSTAEVLEASITTNCLMPLIIVTDITGSMGQWPKVIFSKLPYLELEGQEYLGKDLQIAFGAYGDSTVGDRYPLQMRPFTSGTDLKKRMEELVIVGGGGYGLEESAEMMALYLAYNLNCPNAIRPIVIFITDEKCYGTISKEAAKNVAGVTLQSNRISVAEVFGLLKQKCAVYLIRKPYKSEGGGNTMSDIDLDVRRFWVKLLGEDYVCDLPDAGRVVDVTFGILAKETGRIEYFREELEGRQRPDQVETVFRSLKTIHIGAAGGGHGSGRSILKLPEGERGGKAKKLLN